MINLTEEWIQTAAPNQKAVVSGRDLVKKKKFVRFAISPDQTLLFGECQGSGASNYATSVDFVNAENPVYRCSCPSRQFPCKHSIGLLHAYASGETFAEQDIPADIAEKRQKAEKREEKKAEEKTEEATAKPRKTNKKAFMKKIQTQLEGLELAEKVILGITQSGLGTINVKTLQMLESQAKQLGNYYIPGVQTALREFIVLFKGKDADPEAIYTVAMDRLVGLYALCKKGKEYLAEKLEAEEPVPDTGSGLEEWLGHAWQLAELKELGMVQQDVELLQLSFNTYVDEARQETVDEGLWLDLESGRLAETRNYRPFKAAKYIKEEDSFFSVAQVKELYRYPGEMIPRVRWEGMTMRPAEAGDYLKVQAHAWEAYGDLIKQVKNQIKNPLSDKNPVALLRFAAVSRVGDQLVVESAAGDRLVLADIPGGKEAPTLPMLQLLDAASLRGQVMLVRFHQDLDARQLVVQPLSLITEDRLIRLLY